MRRRWKKNSDFPDDFWLGVFMTWGVIGMIGFFVTAAATEKNGHLDWRGFLALILWLGPIALGFLGAGVRYLWSIRPERVWENLEDARVAHRKEIRGT